MSQQLALRLEDSRRAALPVLLHLLGDPAWAESVPMVLSTLIEDRCGVFYVNLVISD